MILLVMMACWGLLVSCGVRYLVADAAMRHETLPAQQQVVAVASLVWRLVVANRVCDLLYRLCHGA